MFQGNEDVVERTRIREIFVSGESEPIPTVRYFKIDRRSFSELRLDFEAAILNGFPMARCAACHMPVVPRLHYRYKRKHFKHYESDGDCYFKTKGKYSQRQIDAMRYNGRKEGPDHIRLKELLVTSLENDITFNGIRVEERWWSVTDPEKWKKPDVVAEYIGLPVAFEIQLSTTFLSVMAERRKFYLENGGLLVWIFKDVAHEDPRQFQDDVFYNNNSNIFVIDDETVRISHEKYELTFRCHYLKPVVCGSEILEEWCEEFVGFSQLTIDRDNQRAYFFDFLAAEQIAKKELEEADNEDLRRRFLEYWSKLGLYATGSEGQLGNWPVKWNKIVGDFNKHGITLPYDRPDHDLARFSCLTLSTYYGRPIGFAYASENFLQVANYAYDNCKDLIWYFGNLIQRTGQWKIINQQDKASCQKKLKTGKAHHGWDEKWPVVKAIYRHKDPAYPQKRQFDSLFTFLFLNSDGIPTGSNLED